jgi:hypothetical protein
MLCAVCYDAQIDWKILITYGYLRIRPSALGWVILAKSSGTSVVRKTAIPRSRFYRFSSRPLGQAAEADRDTRNGRCISVDSSVCQSVSSANGLRCNETKSPRACSALWRPVSSEGHSICRKYKSPEFTTTCGGISLTARLPIAASFSTRIFH